MKKKNYIYIILGIVVAAIGLGSWIILSNFICKMNDCNKFVASGSKYCKTHTCTLEGCNEQKSTERLYCGIHGCDADNCNELITDKVGSGLLNYCDQHRCKVGNCPEVIYINDHCLLHNCAESNCNEAADTYYSFCDKHKP